MSSQSSPCINHFERPRVLMRAARFGIDAYRRDRALKSIIGSAPAPGEALRRLLAHEAGVDRDRKARRPGYSDVRHISILTAILGEARLAARLEPQTKASGSAALCSAT